MIPHKIHRFFLLLGLVVLTAFTLVPPVHQIPDHNRFIPVVEDRLPPLDTLTLLTHGGEVREGEEICINVAASGFKEILTMQYTMEWDPTVLKFVKLNAFDLEGLSNRNFGNHLVNEGMLTFSWYDQHLLGITKPDDHSLYQLCFQAIGAIGSETSVEITSKPTIVEVSNAAGIFLDLRNEAGLIRIE